MRIALVSPMPPSKSGIADYSAALLEPLEKIASVIVWDGVGPQPSRSDFDVAIYQIGNNGYHAFAYEMALTDPGIVVLHESNLHHLIADLTIKRNDWDSYLRELELNGGSEALAYGQRVRALEVGPDYSGVPMLRTLLDASQGVIVHSHYVEQDVRRAGFKGPVAVIPHGAWIPHIEALPYRSRLGLLPEAPLIGIFGFLKPYKRIVESLRAFKRLVQLKPEAKMILVGEPHPDFPLQSLIDGLGLSPYVRILGFTPIDDFVGYIAAADIILNLRFPTVGESSGTLLRSLGLGRAVIVSDIGSFQEYPDAICLKVPVDETEEDTLFEYLDLLVSRPDLRLRMGERARAWVEHECAWSAVAEQYVAFASSFADGRSRNQGPVAVANAPSPVPDEPDAEPVDIPHEYILGWAENSDARSYVETHITRLAKTLELTPGGSAEKSILEMGAYLQITPALKVKLGYGEVRGCYYGPAGRTDRRTVRSVAGEEFTCEVDLFDAEKDRFPYADGSFDTVLCCELLEHLPSDPMFMMAEINRILKPGGHLVLTTPNVVSLRAIAAVLQSYHPGFFPAYIRPPQPGQEPDARHAREYAPREIVGLFENSGFSTQRLETGEFLDEPRPSQNWVRHMLEKYQLSSELRGDGIYAVGKKLGPVQERYPDWLYS
jgi:glycosyltransferase involved in cell wall biosynthesis/SAM-dependent methyltransferase